MRSHNLAVWRYYLFTENAIFMWSHGNIELPHTSACLCWLPGNCGSLMSAPNHFLDAWCRISWVRFHGSRRWKGQQGEMCLLSFSFYIFYLTKKEEKNVLPENKNWKNKQQQQINRLTLQPLTSPRHRWTVWPPKETQQCPLVIQAKFTWLTWEEKWTNALQKVQIKRDAVTFTGGIAHRHIHIFVWGCEISTTEINLLGRIKITPVFGKEKAHLFCLLYACCE